MCWLPGSCRHSGRHSEGGRLRGPHAGVVPSLPIQHPGAIAATGPMFPLSAKWFGTGHRSAAVLKAEAGLMRDRQFAGQQVTIGFDTAV